MLDEYRIEPLSVGQYLDGVNNEDTKIDQAVQRSFCWNREMMNSLIYSALSRKIYIPNLILAEEKREDGTKQTYVVDGGQRTETLFQFKYCGYKITNNLRTYMIPYRKKKRDGNGNILRDEYGNIQYEIDEFDIRRKTYDDLPDELKNKFDGCPLTTVIYQDCTTEQTSELVMLYNNHVGMNVSQKSLTYVGKYADEIKRIKDTNRFLMDCTVLSENEKRKGIWERVISESVMVVHHFEYWKKIPKDMCSYLNQHSSKEEYRNIELYFNRLIPYSDKLKNTEIAALFTSKNLFVWIKIFDIFSKLHIPDDSFGEFLKAFVNNLKFKKVHGENWDSIDNNRHTKDKSLVVKKVNYLETLMKDFFQDEFEEMAQVVSFIAENLDMDVDVVQSDIDFYEESLDKLKDNTIKDGSKLLNQGNHHSLLAMMVYSYREDKDLEEWMTEYAIKNDSYFTDQKKNFQYMKEDFEKFYRSQKL